jgi:hypothetical protein
MPHLEKLLLLMIV